MHLSTAALGISSAAGGNMDSVSLPPTLVTASGSGDAGRVGRAAGCWMCGRATAGRRTKVTKVARSRATVWAPPAARQKKRRGSRPPPRCSPALRTLKNVPRACRAGRGRGPRGGGRHGRRLQDSSGGPAGRTAAPPAPRGSSWPSRVPAGRLWAAERRASPTARTAPAPAHRLSGFNNTEWGNLVILVWITRKKNMLRSLRILRMNHWNWSNWTLTFQCKNLYFLLLRLGTSLSLLSLNVF